MKEKENEPSYYAIIPAHVRYCKELEPCARLLYGEITALSNQKGYCWATNEYFSELYEVDVRTVKRWIENLAELEFIFVDSQKNGMKWDRKIWISKEMFTKGQKCPLGNNRDKTAPTDGFQRRDKNVPIEGTFLSAPHIYEYNSINNTDCSVTDSAVASPPSKISKKNSRGDLIQASFEDICTKAVMERKDWKTVEIKEAWDILCSYEGIINDPLKFIMGTIEKLRNKRVSGDICKSQAKKKKEENPKKEYSEWIAAMSAPPLQPIKTLGEMYNFSGPCPILKPQKEGC